jgi:UDP-glucose 4-epimerase
MMTGPVLVTGGIGYVGRELVHQLVSEGSREIHVLDNLACGESRLDYMDRRKFSLHRCDLRDSGTVEDVMRKVNPEVIFHLAAIHFIPKCEAEPGDSNSINVSGTINLLNAAPTGAKFVLASTAAVYRPYNGEHVEHDDMLGPVDIYGYTKLHAEHFVRYYHNQDRIRGIIVRLFNVVGPGETNPHLVPAIIGQLASGKTRLALGNLFPHRDYIDVNDVARGFRALGNNDVFEGGPLISNLGTGTTHAVSDVVETIAAAAGVTIDIQQDSSRMRAVDRPMLKASTKKLKQITNWVPSISLTQSMQQAWASRVEDGFA